MASGESLGNARVLCTFERRFRSTSVILGCFCTMVGLLVFILASFGLLDPNFSRMIRFVFGMGSIFWLAVTIRLLVGIVRNESSVLEITTAGISDRSHRNVSWNDVSRLVAGGKPSNATVRIFYFIGTAQVSYSREILSDRPITPASYQNLVEILRREVLPHFPHLRLGDYEPVRNLS